MPVYKPSEEITTVTLGNSFWEGDYTPPIQATATHKLNLRLAPTIQEVMDEWQPSGSFAVLIPREGVIAAIAQFLHNILPDLLKPIVENAAYDIRLFSDYKKTGVTQEDDGSYNVHFELKAP